MEMLLAFQHTGRLQEELTNCCLHNSCAYRSQDPGSATAVRERLKDAIPAGCTSQITKKFPNADFPVPFLLFQLMYSIKHNLSFVLTLLEEQEKLTMYHESRNVLGTTFIQHL